ncbi:DUF2533 family protein [Paenibacillus ginsengihumi]|uniref:DUF2533 family protein n=1 Tax=Paenibacillus ginsengihumi TaxID=431596 RepID=UPI00035EFF9B|nr:DUF2533 family protein [Paenibacillus ginsengihumi]
MNVHEAITSHVKKQNERVREFLALDAAREREIERAVKLCAAGKPFSVEAINRIGDRMNELTRPEGTEARKRVTAEMIEEYVRRIGQSG